VTRARATSQAVRHEAPGGATSCGSKEVLGSPSETLDHKTVAEQGER